MTKFLVTYMGEKAGTFQWEMTEAESAAFMQAWTDWAEKHEAQIVDSGAPCGKTRLVTANGISDTQNAITGYSIVEADSHDAATQMFIDHPHLVTLGLTIEVMECPPIPGM